MTDPEFIVSFLNSGCSKFFYTGSLEFGFSDSQIVDIDLVAYSFRFGILWSLWSAWADLA